jgi:hypothetical protein
VGLPSGVLAAYPPLSRDGAMNAVVLRGQRTWLRAAAAVEQGSQNDHKPPEDAPLHLAGEGRVPVRTYFLRQHSLALQVLSLGRETASDRVIRLELLPGTGHGHIEQVQLLIALLGREVGYPVPVRGMQLLQAREVVGQPHPWPLQALGLVRRRQHPLSHRRVRHRPPAQVRHQARQRAAVVHDDLHQKAQLRIARLLRFLQKLVPAAETGQAREVWHRLALVELPAAQNEPSQGLKPAQDVDPVAAADRRLEQAGIGPAQDCAGRAHRPEQGGDPGIAAEGQGRGLARVVEDGAGEAGPRRSARNG